LAGAGGDLIYQLHNHAENWDCINWGEVLLWGGAGAIAGLTLGLTIAVLSAPPDWIIAGYLLNATWIGTVGTIIAVASEASLIIRVASGDQDAAAVLTGAWYITGESAIVDLFSSMDLSWLTINYSSFDWSSISSNGGEAALRATALLRVPYPITQSIDAIDAGTWGLAGLFSMMNGTSGGGGLSDDRRNQIYVGVENARSTGRVYEVWFPQEPNWTVRKFIENAGGTVVVWSP
jgi:hypothetical protein